MILKTTQGKWRVKVKSRGKIVADKTFDRKGTAQAWEREQKERLANGDWINPRLGDETLGSVVDRWLAIREITVAGKTFQTDEGMTRVHLSTDLKRLPIGVIRSSDIENLLVHVHLKIAKSSVVRFRATLSAMFEWAMRERLIRSTPVTQAHLPVGTDIEAVDEIYPFTAAELFYVHADLEKAGGRRADLALVLGLTGLRWGELMALRPRDIQAIPYPAIRVSRSAPDGQPIRNTTKGGQTRTVPLANELLPIIENWIVGKKPNDLIFANSAGNRIGNSNWTRAVRWRDFSRGRRIHDLRHTAATLWLQSGIDPKTVQTWLGHSSMTLTVDTYAHFMGSDADIAAISRINAALGVINGGLDNRAAEANPKF